MNDMLCAVIPQSEVRVISSEYDLLVRKWTNKITTVDGLTLEAPSDAGHLDRLILEAMSSLVKLGVKSSLKKLSWASYCLYDPSMQDDITLPENRLGASVMIRMMESDLYLTEYREIRSSKDGDRLVQVRHGDLVENVPRTFPMWGEEKENAIDTKEKAIRYYRSKLKERGIL